MPRTLPGRIDQPTTFTQVDSVTHGAVVIAFGEEWPETSGDRKLWYRVLDLDQTADHDLATVWEDATRWARWYEVPWPEEPRPVGMSLFNVYKMVDHH